MNKIFSKTGYGILALIVAITLGAFGVVFANSEEIEIKADQKSAIPGNVNVSQKIREGIGLLKASSPLEFELGSDQKLARKQIALAILNLETGNLLEHRVWVSENEIQDSQRLGSPMLEPADDNKLQVSVQWWNSFNSYFVIEHRPELVVVANKYLVERSYLPEQTTASLIPDAPRSRYVDMVYAPYSELLRTPDVIAEGREYLKKQIDDACEDLRSRQVRSLSRPGFLIADMISEEMLFNLVLVEHVDPQWLALADDGGKALTERTLAIVGANKEWAYRYTNSSAGANGLAQFIESTYDAMVATYPEAKLIVDHRLGMADHRNAFKAMALLSDYNTDYIQKNISPPKETVFITPEMLAAAYNGGPNRVIRSINQLGTQWMESTIFPEETESYIKKYQAIAKLGLF